MRTNFSNHEALKVHSYLFRLLLLFCRRNDGKFPLRTGPRRGFRIHTYAKPFQNVTFLSEIIYSPSNQRYLTKNNGGRKPKIWIPGLVRSSKILTLAVDQVVKGAREIRLEVEALNGERINPLADLLSTEMDKVIKTFETRYLIRRPRTMERTEAHVVYGLSSGQWIC